MGTLNIETLHYKVIRFANGVGNMRLVVAHLFSQHLHVSTGVTPYISTLTRVIPPYDKPTIMNLYYRLLSSLFSLLSSLLSFLSLPAGVL
jgi:hypothetical protein